jgi:hypothetical protein
MYELNGDQEWHCVWCNKKAVDGEGGHLESIPHIKKLGYNRVVLSDAQLRYVGWADDAAMPNQLQIVDRGSSAAASGSRAAAGTAPPPKASPPPPPGQQTDGLSGPPPAPAPAAVSEENVILVKLHAKLDIILDKLQLVEARLAKIERALEGWAWQ